MEVIRGAINDLRNHNDSERYRDHTSHHLNKPDKKDNYINDPQANRKHGNAIGLTASLFVAATNKIKPKLDRENTKKAPYSHHLGSVKHYGGGRNAGPHNSNILNKLDPRVDSSRDDQARSGAFARNTYYYPRDGSTATGSHDTPANKFGPL